MYNLIPDNSLPELEKHLAYADVLRKAAAMEFQKSQHIYQELTQGVEIVTKIILKRNGIDL